MDDAATLAAFRERFAAAIAGPRPVLETDRLVLRPYRLADAADLQRLAGDRLIAATTATIPHPYPDGEAEAFIGAHEARWRDGTHLTCAVTERGVDTLVGAVGLVFAAEHARAELGYWIAVPAWGRGYATEASMALCEYGFATLVKRHPKLPPWRHEELTPLSNGLRSGVGGLGRRSGFLQKPAPALFAQAVTVAADRDDVAVVE
jgi:RimJ/RimL family protein N-acetyltransferase